jgi:histidinol-phosphate aminotransferase
MALIENSVPSPRASVASPDLSRPDWTRGVPRDPDLMWLDKNENADPEFAVLTAAVFREVDLGVLSIYPECTPLYNQLAAYAGVPPDHLLLTAGSDGAIRAVFEAFIDPGDVVLHTSPTFAMYPVYAQMYGARTKKLDYRPSADGPTMDVDDVLAAIDRESPRLVCLPNPDSPTGTVFAPGDLRLIIEAAGRAGAVMLVDEAYFPFYAETALPWVGAFPHLVVARTFAKAWGLAGLRIGYCAAHPALVRLLHKVRPMYEVNTVAVAMMQRMLPHVDAMLASVARLNAGRDAFLDAMAGLGFPVVRARGNFAHAAFGVHAPAIHRALESLVLYRRDAPEPCLRGYSRFSATTRERFGPIVDRIRGAVADSPKETP